MKEQYWEKSVAVCIDRTIALEVDATKISIMAYDENTLFIADLSHAQIDNLIDALKEARQRSIANGGAS